MRSFLLLCTAFLLRVIPAECAQLSGRVFDQNGAPVSGVSVALLYPTDSTLATFAITNREGTFTIKDATEQHYILQASLPGYYTEYTKVDFGTEASHKELGVLVLQKNIDEQKLKEVIISGERIPISIKGDTVEYNASSFRVKPNAPVEDLLRQLPGMQVDEKGNIKSMGKDVKKVLVDGKEFFGTDPKIATKNLPADAIDKVQTFGKHSDESEFSGIDDGTRDQTINLKLKEGKQKGYFGEVKAGAGTEDRYEGGAKIFRFRPKTQAAALASLNNINQFGFSFDDFINFNGGLGGLMNGGSVMNIEDMPVDFGQPVTGMNTSGAAGLNYAMETRPKNRFSISYIGSGVSKIQEDNTYLRNYLPSGAMFTTRERERQERNNMANSANLKWNNPLDSFNQLIFSLNGQIKNNSGNKQGNSVSSILEDTLNRFREYNRDNGSGMAVNGTAGWTHKLRHPAWKLFQVGAQLAYRKNLTDYDWDNATLFAGSTSEWLNHSFQENKNTTLQSSANVMMARAIGKNVYIEPRFSGSYNKESLERGQGIVRDTKEKVDSLSPSLQNQYYTGAAALHIRSGSSKKQWNIGLEGKALQMNPVVNNTLSANPAFHYLLPSLFWRRETGSNHSLELNYTTRIQTPQPRQLLPVLYYSSPLSGIRGDLQLTPEYHHDIHFNYRNFNRFEMSSLFAGINGSYIRHKIGTAVQVLPGLGQQAQWVNTDHAANAGTNLSYSRPVKPLAIDVSLDWNEQLQVSESPVNSVSNTNVSLVHQFGLSLSNRRKKDRWNARLGAEVQLSDIRYSINKELNNRFRTYIGTASLSCQPNQKWFFAADMRMKYYTAQSFDGAISVPLLSAEITRHFLAAQRASITLRAFDLLNKNQAVVRQGLNNMLAEQSSNVLQRYIMLTLTYKLTKMGNGG